MAQAKIGDYTFRSDCDLIDVTSMSRPDPTWSFTDSAGHTFVWHADGVPTRSYSALAHWTVPGTEIIDDGEYTYEDGETQKISHLACRECGATIEPGYRADDNQVFIPGIRRYYVNDESVPPAEFEQLLKTAQRLMNERK